MIKQIKISENEIIYKLKLDTYDKSNLIKELKYNMDVNETTSNRSAGLQSFIIIEGYEINKIKKLALDTIKKQFGISDESSYFMNSWVYVSDNKNTESNYHDHEFFSFNYIKKYEWTWTFYVQMPDNLKGDDGKLCFLNKNKEEISILPEEGELFIFPSSMFHKPNTNLNSTKERIVLAGTYVTLNLDEKIRKSVLTLL